MPGPVRLLLTGDRGAGKSIVAERLAEIAVARGFSVSGTINLKRTADPDDPRIDAIDLRTREKFAFADESDDAVAVGRFRIRRDAIARSLAALAAWEGSDLHVFDEVGRLELRGEGLAEALGLLADPRVRRLLVIVRSELAEPVAKLDCAGAWRAIEVSAGNREILPQQLFNLLFGFA